MRSSVVEHGIADPMVAGSIPVAPFYVSTFFLVSPVGQDTRFSPWRPGFESRTRNLSEAMAQLAARRIPDPKVGGSSPSSLISDYFCFLKHVSVSDSLGDAYFPVSKHEKSGLGLVGYDDCLTRSRSRVQSSELVLFA